MSVHPVKCSDLAVCQALVMGIGMLACIFTLSHYSSSVNRNAAKGNISDQIRTHTHYMNTVHAQTHYRHKFFFMPTLSSAEMMTQLHLC